MWGFPPPFFGFRSPQSRSEIPSALTLRIKLTCLHLKRTQLGPMSRRPTRHSALSPIIRLGVFLLDFHIALRAMPIRPLQVTLVVAIAELFPLRTLPNAILPIRYFLHPNYFPYVCAFFAHTFSPARTATSSLTVAGARISAACNQKGKTPIDPRFASHNPLMSATWPSFSTSPDICVCSWLFARDVSPRPPTESVDSSLTRLALAFDQENAGNNPNAPTSPMATSCDCY